MTYNPPPKPSQYFADKFKMADMELRIINMIRKYKDTKSTNSLQTKGFEIRFKSLFGPNWKVEIEQVLNGIGY